MIMAITKKRGVKKSKVILSKKKPNDLTIHFMPYSEISREDSIGRIKKIMKLICEN